MEYQNLKFLQDSFLLTQNICSWSMTPEGQLLFSNCPEQEFFYNLLSVSRSSGAIMEHFSDSTLPIIASDSIGFAWIAALQSPQETGQIPVIYVLGPLFTSELTEQYLEQHMRKIRPAADAADRLRRFVRGIPTITVELAASFACMLHYCLSSTAIKPNEVERWSEAIETADDVEWNNANWHGTWFSEQRFFKSVTEGRIEGIRELSAGSVGTMVEGDPLRQAKDEAIVFTVLCSRAAIFGGVSPEGALNLSDHFVQQIEAAKNVSAVYSLIPEIHRMYIQRVRKAQASSDCSALVRACREYIETHILEKINLKDMAAEIGYTEPYISRKYKEEMGTSLFDYINQQKIEIAKTILRESTMSVSELSDRLAFTSPSYFSSVFKKYAGITPAAYQNKTKEDPHAQS